MHAQRRYFGILQSGSSDLSGTGIARPFGKLSEASGSRT